MIEDNVDLRVVRLRDLSKALESLIHNNHVAVVLRDLPTKPRLERDHWPLRGIFRCQELDLRGRSRPAKDDSGGEVADQGPWNACLNRANCALPIIVSEVMRDRQYALCTFHEWDGDQWASRLPGGQAVAYVETEEELLRAVQFDRASLQEAVITAAASDIAFEDYDDTLDTHKPTGTNVIRVAFPRVPPPGDVIQSSCAESELSLPTEAPPPPLLQPTEDRQETARRRSSFPALAEEDQWTILTLLEIPQSVTVPKVRWTNRKDNVRVLVDKALGGAGGYATLEDFLDKLAACRQDMWFDVEERCPVPPPPLKRQRSKRVGIGELQRMPSMDKRPFRQSNGRVTVDTHANRLLRFDPEEAVWKPPPAPKEPKKARLKEQKEAEMVAPKRKKEAVKRERSWSVKGSDSETSDAREQAPKKRKKSRDKDTEEKKKRKKEKKEKKKKKKRRKEEREKKIEVDTTDSEIPTDKEDGKEEGCDRTETEEKGDQDAIPKEKGGVDSTIIVEDEKECTTSEKELKISREVESGRKIVEEKESEEMPTEPVVAVRQKAKVRVREPDAIAKVTSTREKKVSTKPVQDDEPSKLSPRPDRCRPLFARAFSSQSPPPAPPVDVELPTPADSLVVPVEAEDEKEQRGGESSSDELPYVPRGVFMRRRTRTVLVDEEGLPTKVAKT